MFTKVLHVSRKVFFCGDFFYLTKNIWIYIFYWMYFFPKQICQKMENTF
jgi:hypothetical protein